MQLINAYHDFEKNCSGLSEEQFKEMKDELASKEQTVKAKETFSLNCMSNDAVEEIKKY